MNAAQPLAWLESFRLEIIDGDSIRSGGDVYRLVGFNTPESGANARCQRERALSQAATDRLSQLVAGGEIDLRRVPCACPRGTEGTGQCNYGRLLRHAQRARTGRRDHPDRRRPRGTLCLHQDVLPAAQGLVPVLKLAATAPRRRFSNAPASC